MPFEGATGVAGRAQIATRDKRIRVELLRPASKARRLVEAARLRPRPEPAPNRSPARFAFYDIGTYYQLASGNVSGYRETATEMPTAPSSVERAVLRDRWLANLTATTVGGSGRAIENCVRLQAGSTETDGTITTLLLRQAASTRRLDLLAATDTWTGQVPLALRQSALASLPAGPSSAHTATVAAGLAAESLESWDAQSRTRTGTDGTIVARLTDGRWTVAVESVRSFYSFDTGDETNYAVTDAPAFERSEASRPAVLFGDRQATSVDIWLVPQLHQWRLDWITRYLFISIYGSFQVVESPNTGAFMSRLPFYPVRYSMTLVGSAVQAASISSAIVRTTTYAQMIAGDVARQYVTPFSAFLLDGRVNGEWKIYQREVAVGQLVGVLDYRYQDGPPLRRYIWRRTLDARAFTLLDSGALNVPGEVTGII